MPLDAHREIFSGRLRVAGWLALAAVPAACSARALAAAEWARGSSISATASGVPAVSSAVTGPFLDPVGAPLLPCGDDPTVFRDDDGRAYLCGNCGGPFCAELAPNMTALASAPAHLAPPLPQWFEAPWLSKWGGVYYLSYMCGVRPILQNKQH